MNNFKTAFLLTALTLLLLFFGRLFGGSQGMTLALVMAVGMNLVAYFYSDKIALAMSGARPVSRAEAPRFHAIVERLVGQANLPMPRLYVIPAAAPNAFATGRNPQHAAVAVTEGILELMTDEELEGVIAHELGHVRNRDILISSVAAMIAGAVTYLSYMGRFAMLFGGGRDDDNRGGGFVALLMLILAPIAALIIQLAISRSREYEADATGARLAGHPYGLARALEKLEAYNKRIPMDVAPSTAHLYIVKPFSGSTLMSLFSTHPPIEKRVARLLGRA